MAGIILGGPRSSCPVEKQCLDWAFRYFGDCVCSVRDDVSFALGLMSVVAWAVAEVPQIITNFFAGSTEGISLAFLMTWTVGDAFNLIGCYLEPATLPTQFYMAVMYTITTIILVAQTFYYEVLHPKKKAEVEALSDALLEEASPEAPSSPIALPPPATQPTEIISVPLSRKTSARDIHIHSARSLASSFTPTMGSMKPGSHHRHHVGSLLSQSPGFGMPHASLRDNSSYQSHQHRSHLTGTSSSPLNTAGTSPALRSVAFSVLLFGGSRLIASSLLSHSALSSPLSSTSQAASLPLVFSSRRLLQVPSFIGSYRLRQDDDINPVGELLGWLMAAIYMGGRLPQIWLNIQRGTVEGLSPLMFLFALVGNATYVASILVRSMAWEDIKPNLPWLVDAAVCVLLDLFILCQFAYYSYRKTDEEDEDIVDYEQLK